jgi:Reverse transcriptase (RNA-dependent DNA polymerase)/Endonuclease-reverse transcriptase
MQLYYQNARGLRTKTNDLLHNVQLSTYDIICLTETWLKDGVFNRELFDDRYDVFRRDRDILSSDKSDGGGVLIAIKKSKEYVAVHKPNWQCDNVEEIWVTLSFKTHNVNICCVYIPGEHEAKYLETFVNNINSHINNNASDVFLILGDLNIPSFGSPNVNSRNAKVMLINDLMSSNNLDQFNKIRSDDSSNNLLDLVFCNDNIRVSKSIEYLSKVDIFHPPLLIDLNVNNAFHKQKVTFSFRNYKKIRWNLLNNDLMSINWENEFNGLLDVDEFVDVFYSFVEGVLNAHCPRITKTVNPAFKHRSKRTNKLLNNKRKYYNKWKKHGNRTDLEMFKTFSAQARLIDESDLQKFYDKTEQDLQENPRSFWKYVNSRKTSGASVGNYMTLDERVACGSKEVADILADYFESVYAKSDDNIIDKHNFVENNYSSDSKWSEQQTSLTEIYNKLRSLDAKKSSGPDELPATLLKNCATAFSYPLSIIYNKSLSDGKFPTAWKLAYLTPIHKSESLHDARNFRPISKLSIVAKILDNLMADQLFNRCQHLISPHQHGFFKTRSTATNLIPYANNIQRVMDGGGQVDVIGMDVAKAFDKIDHSLIIKKLKAQCGVDGNILKWFNSYLRGRKQRVQIDNNLSKEISVSSSIVQGSHLGPILFNLFFNDVCDVLKDVEYEIYADDLKISKNIKTLTDCEILQRTLIDLSSYMEANRLSLNVKKCFIIRFTRKSKNFIEYSYNINNVHLTKVDKIRDLGVIFDSKCNFNDHILAIRNKAKRMAGFVKRVASNFNDPRTLIALYKSLVRSNLEYCAIIWNPHCKKQVKQVESVQHNFIKYVASKFWHDNNQNIDYKKYEKLWNLEPLEYRRVKIDLKTVINSFCGKMDSQTFINHFNFNVPSRNIRQKFTFKLDKCKTDMGRFSIINRIMDNFNYYINDSDYLHENFCHKCFLTISKAKFAIRQLI